MSEFESKLLEIAAECEEHHYEGLCRIAQALNRLADAISEKHRQAKPAAPKSKRVFAVETFNEATGIGTALSRVPGEPLFVFDRDDLVPGMNGVCFEGERITGAADIYGGLHDVAALDLEGDSNEK